jgi:hypothetical protein
MPRYWGASRKRISLGVIFDGCFIYLIRKSGIYRLVMVALEWYENTFERSHLEVHFRTLFMRLKVAS